MIVVAGMNAGVFYAQTEQEVAALVEHIMNDLIQSGRTPDGFEIIPERADVSIVPGKYPEETDERWPSNYLYVSVNTRSGYGALKWWTNKVSPGAPEDDLSQFIWTSSSPNPPSSDPMLISDPGTPTYYSREAAIPVSQVRKALEEFCRDRTGERPNSVSWLLLEQTV
ncbi:Imm1 family immunity protein [Streptomyces sp. NPDC059477]|uniref:Imm1 family immunity protein n=1 Tax=Streptomyces sp. NPDC059477 TaxID=3346847 RepID=UPI00367BD53B